MKGFAQLRRICFLSAAIFFRFAIAGKAQTDTIQVFVNPGCERCNQIEKTLQENKIPFHLYSIHNKVGHSKLAVLMDAAGVKKGEKLNFPVVVYKGKTNYNIEDLDAFMKSVVEKK